MTGSRITHPRRWWFATAVVATAALLTGGVAVGAGSSASGALGLHVYASPVRVLDTRTGAGGVAAVRLGPAKAVDVLVPNLPSDAQAVSVNITVMEGTTASSLKVFATGTVTPHQSIVSFGAGDRSANDVTVGITANHKLRVLNQGGYVHVVLDVLGYYAPAGANGAEGPMGPQGPAGADGPMGPAGADAVGGGPAGSVYVYATNSSDQIVHRGLGNALSFDTVGPKMGDISFTAGTSDFTVGTAGVYKVTMWALAEDDNQLDVRVNGQIPSMGLVVFGALAHQPTTGSAVLTLEAGDVVTVENVSSTGSAADDPLLLGDLVLSTFVGGSRATTNAWIMIEQLNAP